jgi:hypothetical protein
MNTNKRFGNSNKKAGFIKTIIIIIIAILALGYFNISLKELAEKPKAQESFSYVKENTETIWSAYLEKPFLYIWNNIFIDLLWGAFTENMKRVKEGRPTTLEESAPQVNFADPYEYYKKKYLDRILNPNKPADESSATIDSTHYEKPVIIRQ